MRKSIAAVVLGLLATFLPIAAGQSQAAAVPIEAAPVQARAIPGGYIIHINDAGYDTGFYTATHIDMYGRPYCPCFLINENHDSREYTGDVDAIYVYEGQEVWCVADTAGLVKFFDATGWYKVVNGWGAACESRAD